ncbi:hypothetical protein KUTeg_013586 [Tegillarca granosa]|uniref:Uncharacterized protein n=1 Tax=Tegillarca granosa TaxID=220873 RepID=A0ABQ9EYM3_TEGGR|nr:hypothetical protein KUTeg_013586 [Tegillarca granosa]
MPLSFKSIKCMIMSDRKNCSSSDSEHSKTLDIINKLSKKYLNKDNEYDGDAENTTEGSESSGSTGSIDAYEFDEEDVMDVSPKLSVKYTNKKKQQKRKPDIEKKSSKKQPLKNSDIVNKQKYVESQVSGKIPLLNAKDTSTPSTEVRSRRKRGNDAFGFGEPVHSILPEISPVQKVDPVTPLSDYASMDTIPSISFDDSSIMKDNSIVKDSQFQLFSMEEDEDFSLNRSSSKTYKVQKKKQPKKKVVQNPKVEKMLVEMNTKFEEIEKFELSIE